jgi:regulator of protease activity HflC (stomatin/prohibitin superfamily)
MRRLAAPNVVNFVTSDNNSVTVVMPCAWAVNVRSTFAAILFSGCCCCLPQP